jgi:hypothetical protein
MSKTLLNKYVEIFSVFLLLLSGGSVPFLFYRKELFFVVLVFFALLLFSKRLSYKELRQLVFVLVSITLFLLINYLFAISEQSIQKVSANLTIMFSATFVVMYFNSSNNKNKFTDYLYFALLVVLFHSLINFFLYPLISDNLSSISNWHYECSSFLKLFFYNPQKYSFDILGFSMVRNQGLFWEPGVLQVFLNILLFLSLFVRRFKLSIVGLISLAVLSTLSTTGLLIMILQFVVYSTTVVRKNILLLPLFIALLLGLYSLASLNLSDKILGDGATSFQVRFFDLVQPVLIAIDYPLTGVGLDDQRYIEVRNRIDYNLWIDGISFDSLEKGATNSIMFFLATTGYPATILLLWMIYRQTLISNNKKLFFVLMIFSLMTEPLLLKPFFFIFVISGVIYSLNKFRWKTY